MVEVEELSFSYPSSAEPAVETLSFRVESQEIFGFLGPSGAGKSTTQKILIGLLRGYTGSARVLDREVSAWGHDYYEEVGVSFELPNHHKRLTALENLQHFASLYERATIDPRELLDWVGLSDAADQPASELSKGMKIRLNVARSLLHRPKVLFLDEPTSGLDPVNARNIKDLVRRVRDEGATVFLTTHDMMVADQLCDRVAFIAAGAIAAVDAPDRLKRAHGKRVVRVTYRNGEGTASADFPLDGLGTDEDFRALLAQQTIESIHSQETTLENVFIEVTGHRLKP